MSKPIDCPNDWHLGWKGLVIKYGEKEAEKRYRFLRTCPTCGEKIDLGD